MILFLLGNLLINLAGTTFLLDIKANEDQTAVIYFSEFDSVFNEIEIEKKKVLIKNVGSFFEDDFIYGCVNPFNFLVQSGDIRYF